jgi:uncharacterized protein (TIGR03067 family)
MDDKEAMQGPWALVYFGAGPTAPEYRPGPRQPPEEPTMLVTDDTIDFGFNPEGGAEPTAVYRFALDPTKSPKEVDLRPGNHWTVGDPIAAIYSLDGDELTICESAEGQPRPTEFKPVNGVLRVFRRVRA